MAAILKRDTVLKTVRTHQETLREMGVKSLTLFGSVARDQAKEDSDVDFLVEFSQPIGFFQLFDVKHYLESILECSVDVGTAGALKSHLRQPVLEDAICVF
ncbi:nucleotidyltransferase family protein [Oscillatoria sp. CS-180]|uniref:nucleotidyltransferase family protein n=1 Tax=Oscillatoria sp. CS-180 TaxID=3021720 RepID=UPI00232D4145|nr:nucleotidyltransferase family protein [Oscillatoria sp. CS-180]MDB9526002.1 nucleotidyltransferase family protein [Oscillatoria sp. CS-180]